MSVTSDKLFAYLRSIFYASPDAKLNIEELEDDYVLFGKGLMFFARCFMQYNEFATALGRGDLSVPPPPPENELAAPLKSLHASLKHLTWQSKQVALGDYKQRVDFMGEFADAFNTMVEQLADRQQKLENEIEQSIKHAAALEQGNKLLSNVTQYIPQQIFVMSADEFDVLLMNDMAQRELEIDPNYIESIRTELSKLEGWEACNNAEILLYKGDSERYLSVSTYQIEWDNVNAVALVLNDVSVEKKQMKELETHAYGDSMTNLFNRFYGMLTLNDWVDAKKQFVLVFVDMDNLKYVNDQFGHNDGDRYIITVADHLRTFSPNVVSCRIGGDEFMVLTPDVDGEVARARMEEVQTLLRTDEYLVDKDYSYSVSYGIVVVGKDNELPSSGILSLADERMYEHKRARKKERQVQKAPST